MTFGMAVDLRETDDANIVETVLPGATTDDIDISVLGDRLRIAAEISESQQQEAKWLVRECRYGSFERSITLPKAEESRARQIPVNTAALTGGSEESSEA